MIMNWGMRNICGFVFDYIKQNSEELPQRYHELRQQKPEFYAYLEEKIKIAKGEM